MLIRCQVSPHNLEVVSCTRFTPIKLSSDASIQDIFRKFAMDLGRTSAIAGKARNAFQQGRKVLVLTERTDHLDDIAFALVSLKLSLLVHHRRLSNKKRTILISEQNALPPDENRILMVTGKLVGEGFDHPPLDTLVLAIPV